MEMNDYQEAARTTAIYPPDQALNYLVPALTAEAGEVAGKWAKIQRDQGGAYDQQDADAMADELGDVLWMVAMLAVELDKDLEGIAERNLAKLSSRQQRGVLGGSGDNR